MVHPNSLANLKNGKKFQTGDERASSCGMKGREALTENIRAEKTAREIAKMLLDMEVVEPRAMEKLKNRRVKKEDRSYMTALFVSVINKGLATGDQNILKFLLQVIGEMPKDEMAITNIDAPQVTLYLPEKDAEPE